ncbi:MAG TPA: hypothetical protein VFH94_03445 [Streptomyces sp.]|nr:hypothetical protein [Streptomyces sp.]
MTHTPRTPPPTTAALQQRPFTRRPGRWRKEQSRALRTGHRRGSTCTAECRLVLVYERTGWGWLAWTVPADGSPPAAAHAIGVLPPDATRTDRLAACWLTRRPARHIALTPASRVSLRLSAAAVGVFSLLTALPALGRGAPADLVLPAMLLAPLLAEHLPGRLDARARAHVRSVEGDAACRYLQRLATLHASLARAAAGSDRDELRYRAQFGRRLLWETAGLLHDHDTRSASPHLIDRERLMVRLADQVARGLEPRSGEFHPADADQLRGHEGPPAFTRPVSSHGPYPAPRPARER